MTTGPLPGSDVRTSSQQPGGIEEQVIVDEGLGEVSWFVEDVPRLSTKGTRRGLITSFGELSVDTVPVAEPSSLGARWSHGPQEGERLHPEGACIRFRITLSSGSYATTLLPEFMQAPLLQMP